MGFLEIDFRNKGQNAVDEVDREETAAYSSVTTRLVHLEIGLN